VRFRAFLDDGDSEVPVPVIQRVVLEVHILLNEDVSTVEVTWRLPGTREYKDDTRRSLLQFILFYTRLGKYMGNPGQLSSAVVAEVYGRRTIISPTKRK
jgi:hypothetical protein